MDSHRRGGTGVVAKVKWVRGAGDLFMFASPSPKITDGYLQEFFSSGFRTCLKGKKITRTDVY